MDGPQLGSSTCTGKGIASYTMWVSSNTGERDVLEDRKLHKERGVAKERIDCWVCAKKTCLLDGVIRRAHTPSTNYHKQHTTIKNG